MAKDPLPREAGRLECVLLGDVLGLRRCLQALDEPRGEQVLGELTLRLAPVPLTAVPPGTTMRGAGRPARRDSS